jgi:hypothetical protein
METGKLMNIELNDALLACGNVHQTSALKRVLARSGTPQAVVMVLQQIFKNASL